MTFNELMENEELAKFIKLQGKKYMRYYAIHNYKEEDDFIQDLFIWISERLHKFNKERAGITTFLTLYIKAYCGRVVQHSNFKQNKWYERANEIMMSQVTNGEGTDEEDKFNYFGVEDNWENTDNLILIEEIKEHLSDLDCQAIDLILEGYSFKEVAQKIGRSAQWVSCPLMHRIRRVAKALGVKKEETL